jgi:hypothetical protein
MMDGSFLIGARAITRPETFRSTDPSTGALVEPAFSISTTADVADACTLADLAFDAFREVTPQDRAHFLEEIAQRIQALGDTLVQRAMIESGLPQARLAGELGRTTGQLRLFARVLREGHWAGVTLDPPLPDRVPGNREGASRASGSISAGRERHKRRSCRVRPIGGSLLARPGSSERDRCNARRGSPDQGGRLYR